MTTPADELRAAATKLRALATALDDCRGPWYVVNGGLTYPQRIDNIGVPYVVATTYDGPEGQPPPTALYIAAMHPGVGLALADWLDTAAVNAAVLTWPNQFIESALAVARQILGTTP